jgi:hypothetical protein
MSDVGEQQRRHMGEHGLGWKPGRGTAPRMLSAIALPEPEVERKMWWMSGWWGDQGGTSQCVIYSWLHALHDGPLTPKRGLRAKLAAHKPIADPTTLYHEGQAIDGTPQWDVHSGLTCNAGAQVMRRHGWIGEYRWAASVDEVVRHLLVAGPVLIGAWWYDSMFDVPQSGKMVIEGSIAGGHQWVLNGVEVAEERIRAKNSWGRAWGRHGSFDITFDQLGRMLEEGAECCAYRELPITIAT